MKKIAFVTPSGFLSQHHIDSINQNKDYFESLGYKVVYGKHIFDEKDYLAGTDKERASDIMNAYKDKNVVAIVATRGGFGGCASLLPFLDFDIIKDNPKPFIGFSDITSIQNAIYTKTKQASFSGFMSGFKIKEKTAKLLNLLLENKSFDISSGKSLKEGEALGVLIGGNFAIFRNMFGTKYCPDLKNKILLLEDEDEDSHNIYMMLTQLKEQKNFKQLKGIIFGDFKNCNKQFKEEKEVFEFIEDFVKDLSIPVIKDFKYGHVKDGHVVPIGRQVRITSSKKGCKLYVD